MATTTWYCTRCGEVAPLKFGFSVSDPRYALVSHHGHDYPAISDREKAAEIRAKAVERKTAGLPEE
jgi:hypothetical protein